MQEDRRLFFVAMTRAKKELIFTRSAGKDNKPYIDSPFILEAGISPNLVSPKGKKQQQYLDVISKKELVFGIGPAGTGKTYLAVASAVNELITGRVEKVVVTRPAVEAGEKLGFLPGSMEEKINPYLTPLYDALYAMLSPERRSRLTFRTARTSPLRV